MPIIMLREWFEKSEEEQRKIVNDPHYEVIDNRPGTSLEIMSVEDLEDVLMQLIGCPLGTLTLSQRAELDRNLISFYDARETLTNQLNTIVNEWDQLFETMSESRLDSEDGEEFQRRIKILHDTIYVLEDDCVLPLGEFDLSLEKELTP